MVIANIILGICFVIIFVLMIREIFIGNIKAISDNKPKENIVKEFKFGRYGN
jgi:hypothetical protein